MKRPAPAATPELGIRPGRGGAADPTEPSTTQVSAFDEAQRGLEALDAATVTISQELSLKRVLQIIVESVRPLVSARYAALGILDEQGRLERFITSGMTVEQERAIGERPQGRGLLGILTQDGDAVRVSDIGVDHRSVGFPAGHPTMTTFLGVPIHVEGRAIGRLYLTDRKDLEPFSEADERLVESFARHAGLAIHNARMHEELRQLAVLKERERIAQDLHDGSIQSLYAVSLLLEDTQESIRSEPDRAVERLDHAIDSIHGTIREIREFIMSLDDESNITPDLLAGLDALTDAFERSTLVKVDLRGDSGVALDADAATQLVQLTRETLSNVARHAGASTVKVVVSQHPGRLRLSIIDDGRGFDTRRGPRSGHHGLTNMRARAESLGGTLSVESDGGGTEVVVEVPLADRSGSKEPSE